MLFHISSNNVKTLLHIYDHCSMMYIYLFYFFPIPSSSTNCLLLFAIIAIDIDLFTVSYVSPSSCYRFNCPNPSFYLHLLHPFLYIHEYFPIHRMIVAFITCPFYILVDCFWSDPTSSVRSYYRGQVQIVHFIQVVVVNWKHVVAQRPCHDATWQYYDHSPYYDTIVPRIRICTARLGKATNIPGVGSSIELLKT